MWYLVHLTHCDNSYTNATDKEHPDTFVVDEPVAVQADSKSAAIRLASDRSMGYGLRAKSFKAWAVLMDEPVELRVRKSIEPNDDE